MKLNFLFLFLFSFNLSQVFPQQKKNLQIIGENYKHICQHGPDITNYKGPNIDTEQLLEGNYKFISRLVVGKLKNYERWLAKAMDTNQLVIIKLYTKKNGTELWKYKDDYPDPSNECKQLEYLNEQLKAKNIKTIRFERCLTADSSGSTSDIPYYNIFKLPQGEPLSRMCIKDGNCRSNFAKISQLLIQTLKLLASGQNSFLVIDNLNVDNVYYYEIGKEFFITITDMKFNSNPISDIKQKPWKKDMDDIGHLLTDILAQNCNTLLLHESKLSSLALYLNIHNQKGYDNTDLDVGVPTQLLLQQKRFSTYKQKEQLLAQSIYQFIVKCFDTQNQFASPSQALMNNFLQNSENLSIDRPSDI